MTTVRTLPVRLTKVELEDRAKLLAKSTRDKEEATLQKKDSAAQFDATIKACDSSISRAAQAINTGVEYREVKCKREYDWKDGRKHLMREDTFEIVESMDISQNERQTKLGKDEAEATI